MSERDLLGQTCSLVIERGRMTHEARISYIDAYEQAIRLVELPRPILLVLNYTLATGPLLPVLLD